MVPRTRQASHGIGAVWRVVDALPGPQPAPAAGPRCLCSLGATARLTPFFAATAGSGMHVWSLSTREGGARVLTTAAATCIERHALPHPVLALLPVDAELIGVAANGAVERFTYARAPSTPVDRTRQQLKLAIIESLPPLLERGERSGASVQVLLTKYGAAWSTLPYCDDAD